MTAATDISIRSRSRSKSVLRSAFDNLMEARQRQADRHVAGMLAMLRREERANSGFEATSPERR